MFLSFFCTYGFEGHFQVVIVSALQFYYDILLKSISLHFHFCQPTGSIVGNKRRRRTLRPYTVTTSTTGKTFMRTCMRMSSPTRTRTSERTYLGTGGQQGPSWRCNGPKQTMPTLSPPTMNKRLTTLRRGPGHRWSLRRSGPSGNVNYNPII